MKPRAALALRLAADLAVAAVLLWTASAADLARPPELSDEQVRRLWDKAVSARDVEDDAASLRAVDRLLLSFPSEPRYLSLEAQELERLRRPADAARAWEEFMKSAPFPTDACPGIGRDYAASNMPEEALDAHRRCLTLDPTKTDLIVYLANALSRSGQDREAAGLYARAVAQSPHDPDATLGPVRLAVKHGDLREAERLLAPIYARDPRNCDVLLERGQLSLQERRAAGALSPLAQAARLCPRYEDVLRALLRAQKETGDGEGARKTRQRLDELVSEDGP